MRAIRIGISSPQENIYSFLNNLDASYYKFDEASGNILPYGKDEGQSTAELVKVGTGNFTYAQSLSNYPSAPHAIQFDGTVKLHTAKFSSDQFPNLVTQSTDQTMFLIMDTNGATMPNSVTVFDSGGDRGSNSSAENSKFVFSVRGSPNVNVLRCNHEYGSGVDTNVHLGNVPPDSYFTGEQMFFAVRDNTAETYTVYYDNAGTLTLYGSGSFANVPNGGTGNDRITIAANSDHPVNAPNLYQQGLTGAINRKLTLDEMQRIIDLARAA